MKRILSRSDVRFRPRGRRIVIGFVLVATVLAIAAVFLHHGVSNVLEGSREVGQVHQTLASVHAVSARVREVEAAKRGYLLTGEPTYLAAYHVAVARVPQDLEKARRSTADDPTHSALLDRLEEAVGKRLSTAARLVDSYRRHGLAAAQDEMRSSTRKSQEDAVTDVSREIEAEHGWRLDERHRTIEEAARMAVVVGGTGFAGCFVGFVLAFVVIGRELSLRRRTEASLERANVRLERSLAELRNLTTKAASITALEGYLQACRTPQEGYDVLAHAIPHLLPGLSGAVGVADATRGLVETVATWGPRDERSTPVFSTEECWGLRKGRSHYTGDGWDPACGHAKDDHGVRLCLPMAVHGETLGVLTVSGNRPEGLTEQERRTAKVVAEHVSLALANLRLQQALRDLARRDPLTGLFNRRYLEETLAREASRARRLGQPMAVIMTDVDHFKRFNDTYGHEAGDAVLTAVSRTLASHVRGEDVACRYGGEEFCLILPGADLEAAFRRAEEIRECVEQLAVSHGGAPLGPITLSAGVAVYPTHDEAAVIAAADAALYRAKRQGRNRVVAEIPATSDPPGAVAHEEAAVEPTTFDLVTADALIRDFELVS